jgi:SecD/SecF fusion protein
VVEERSVGPSLGADSIRAGVTAGAVASVLVLTFMVVAYGLFGLFANISLALNIVLILGSLSALGATLTLPGIAGIVLTIGVAVDANVLIYERMREEQRAGKSILASLDAGFQRAWGTIIDSHLTQLIAAIVLYFLGSGPIQGFAVTLALGILTSLFTAYTVTRFFISLWYRVPSAQDAEDPAFPVHPGRHEDRLHEDVALRDHPLDRADRGGHRLAFTKGFNLGIDFVGGSAIEVQHTAEGDADPAKVRELLDAAGAGRGAGAELRHDEDLLVRIQLQPGGDAEQQAAVEKVTMVLAHEKLRDAPHRGGERHGVGRTGGNGTIAVLVSLVAILIYVWFRFEWQFGARRRHHHGA